MKKQRVDGLGRLENWLETQVRWMLSRIRSGGMSHCKALEGQGGRTLEQSGGNKVQHIKEPRVSSGRQGETLGMKRQRTSVSGSLSLWTWKSWPDQGRGESHVPSAKS